MGKNKLSRRKFIKEGFGKTIALSSVVCIKPVKNFYINKMTQKENNLQIKEYRDLGTTGFKVSDIGLGVNSVFDPSVIMYAIDHGINFIDTGSRYVNGNAIKTVGRGLKGRRDKVWISDKFLGFGSYPDYQSPEFKRWLMEGIEDDLKNLQTDYIDSILMYNVTEKMYERKDEVYEIFEKAKAQGKVRYFGMSGHNANFESTVEKALQTKQFSFIMPRFNFLLDEKKKEVYERAYKNGIAVIGMKTFAGLFNLDRKRWEKLNEGKKIVGRNNEYTVAFTQAALRYILSIPYISTAALSMKSFDHVNAYLPMSGKRMEDNDWKILEEYEKMVYNIYCRPDCYACNTACPHNVPVSDILRFRMYFENYHFERLGIEEYARINPEIRGDKCFHCDAPCIRKCPYGLNIKERVSQTHEMLSI